MAIGRNIITGIDVGTYQIKVVVSENSNDNEKGMPKVLGVGFAESKGLRHGYITNITETARSIRHAVAQAEKSAGVSIKKAYVSVGGIGLSAIISIGGIATTKADSEITDLDVKRAIEESEKNLPDSFIKNRKIVHTIPLEFKIDGKKVLGRPQGMKGLKLEARTLFITCLAHHVNDLFLAFDEANINVEDMIASPMAASSVTLTKTQKIAGCVLANIGSETVTIVVFENSIPISLEVFPIGSNDITNDIALGLKIPIEEAEQIKLGGPKALEHSKKKLDEIVYARLSDIFELIEAHLKKIDRNGLLPAGIIITGGGSGIASIEELARVSLRLPSKKASVKFESNVKGPLKDTEWAVAYGLCVTGLTNEDSGGNSGGRSKPPIDIFAGLIKWFKKFLP